MLPKYAQILSDIVSRLESCLLQGIHLIRCWWFIELKNAEPQIGATHRAAAVTRGPIATLRAARQLLTEAQRANLHFARVSTLCQEIIHD